MSFTSQLKNVAQSVMGSIFRSALITDMTNAEAEINRIGAKVDPQHDANGNHKSVVTDTMQAQSITLGGVQRNTWPDPGPGAAALDDVLKNGFQSSRAASIGKYLIQKVVADLPAITIVDYAFHLAKNDTDKGAWRKRKGQSWRSEARTTGKYLGAYANGVAAVNAQSGAVGDYYYDTTSGAFEAITGITGTPPAATATSEATTYRAGGEDYPTNALITAEAARVIIWDLDGSSPTMWAASGVVTGITGVSARDGHLVVSHANGLLEYNFLSGEYSNYGTAGKRRYKGSASFSSIGIACDYVAALAIINATVNSVAITVLPDAPLDEFGMPVPTIAVATAGGFSVIKQDGTVATPLASGILTSCGFNDIGNAWAGAQNVAYVMFSAAPYSTYTYVYTNATIPATIAGTLNRLAIGKKQKWVGNSAALHAIVSNLGTSAASLMAYITNAYNTGWMVGDIRACFYANSLTADRSVKGLTLTTVGTVTETVNAGGRNVYSNFSATNYSQIASNAAFNALGTGDFSILMSAVKWGTAGTLKTLLSIGDGASAGSLEVQQLAANTLALLIHNGTSLTAIATSTAAFTDAAEHTIEVKRGTFGGVANTVQILVDGVVVASAVSALTISNATGFLRIGEAQAASRPWTSGQVACFRISATAPTAEQSKFIAATENALNGGAACLLSNSASVSDLRYHADSDLLAATNGTATDYFNGLHRVGSVTTASGITGASAEGQLPQRTLLKSGTVNKFWAAERNINAELQEYMRSDIKPTFKQIASDAAGKLTFPQGMKPTRVNSTAGTYVSLATSAPTFDGFLWSISGLSASTNYDCELVAD